MPWSAGLLGVSCRRGSFADSAGVPGSLDFGARICAFLFPRRHWRKGAQQGRRNHRCHLLPTQPCGIGRSSRRAAGLYPTGHALPASGEHSRHLDRVAVQSVADAFPDRFHETWRDRLVDVLPARIWPNGKYLFFLIGLGLFILSGLGFFRISAMRSRGQVPTEKVIQLKTPPPPNKL